MKLTANQRFFAMVHLTAAMIQTGEKNPVSRAGFMLYEITRCIPDEEPACNQSNGGTRTDKTMLDRVCSYLYFRLNNGRKLTSKLIDDMRKAMEE